MIDNALTDIRVLYEGGVSRTGWKGSIRKEDVLIWSKECGLSIKDTFDQIGVALARAFITRTLDWDFCDSAANDLFGVLMGFHTDNKYDVEEPKLFWKFYLAFDHSEMAQAEKSDEVARVEISEFLSELPARA